MKTYQTSVELNLFYDQSNERLLLGVTVKFPGKKNFDYSRQGISRPQDNLFEIIYKETANSGITSDRQFIEIFYLDLGHCQLNGILHTLGSAAMANDEILSHYKVEVRIINEGTGLVGSTFTGISDDADIDLMRSVAIGKVDTSFPGISDDADIKTKRSIAIGKVDTSFTGISDDADIKIKRGVAMGKVDASFTGISDDADIKIKRSVAMGKVNTSFTGISDDADIDFKGNAKIM